MTRTSLVVQWLRLHAPSAGGLGSIPGQGTRSHKLQLRVCSHNYSWKTQGASTKHPYAAMKMQDPACHSGDLAQPSEDETHAGCYRDFPVAQGLAICLSGTGIQV